MKILLPLLVWILLVQPASTAEKILVYFSPDGGCTEAVARWPA